VAVTLTSEALTKALFIKTGEQPRLLPSIAHAITTHELHLAIMPGVRPAITFEAYSQALFGQKLDGSPVRRKRA
jgi:hypothetical protein